MVGRAPKKQPPQAAAARTSDVLDVAMTAQFLTVSADTVYDLFKRGELPGRKVGRKWITTKAAVLRWIESSSETQTLARAIGRGDKQALNTALNAGTAQIGKRK